LLELQLLLNATANEKVQDAKSFLCGLSGIRHVGIVGLSSEHVNALSAAQMELQSCGLSYPQHLTAENH
jgi:hypothetical protein